jgi:hypothetical protein
MNLGHIEQVLVKTNSSVNAVNARPIGLADISVVIRAIAAACAAMSSSVQASRPGRAW